MIDLLRFTLLELDVERTMRFDCPCEDHHTAGNLIQAMDNIDFTEFIIKHLDQVRRIPLPSVWQNGEPGRFVNDKNVFIFVYCLHGYILL